MEESKLNNCDESYSTEFSAFCSDSDDNDNNNNDNNNNNSPIKLKDTWLHELSSYFKLNNLLNFLREPSEQKHDISIPNSIMNCFINKKLGTITYHYDNKKSMKAYHTYDYPEVYCNKKLYNNCDEWIKNEFPKK
jgi:hypothetical protein